MFSIDEEFEKNIVNVQINIAKRRWFKQSLVPNFFSKNISVAIKYVANNVAINSIEKLFHGGVKVGVKKDKDNRIEKNIVLIVFGIKIRGINAPLLSIG